jgi:hypothetical protein
MNSCSPSAHRSNVSQQFPPLYLAKNLDSSRYGGGITASLTTGKANAVRAAFKAGVKPPVIARQFGISRSDVSKVLASGRRDRKSGR